MLKISCVTLRDYYIKYCLLHLQEENPQDRKVMRVRRCDGVPPSRWDPVSHWHSPGTFLTENSQSSFYVSTPGGRWVPDRGLSIVFQISRSYAVDEFSNNFARRPALTERDPTSKDNLQADGAHRSHASRSIGCTLSDRVDCSTQLTFVFHDKSKIKKHTEQFSRIAIDPLNFN